MFSTLFFRTSVHYDKSCVDSADDDKDGKQQGVRKMGAFMKNYFKPQKKPVDADQSDAAQVDSDREGDSDHAGGSDEEQE